jgi:hypothetical protein
MVGGCEFGVLGDDVDGEGSSSSPSPQYRRMPSAPVSTFGGFLKCVLSKYSALIASAASSGSDEGDRSRPFSTSSIL